MKTGGGILSSGALSTALICALAMAANVGATTLLHYDFSNAGGTTVTDLSGKANHGTLGGFTDTTAGIGSFRTSEGWVNGGGLSFLNGGARSFVETPLALNTLFDAGTAANKNFTVEYKASFGVGGFSASAVADNAAVYSSTTAFDFAVRDNSSISLRTPAGGAGAITPHPWGGPTVDATTHHVAMTYDINTDQIEMYVDGSSVGTAPGNFQFDPALAADGNFFRIGNTGHNAGEQWGGVISGVAITKNKLSPSTFVLTNGNQADTKLHYNFSNNSGTSVTDQSGSGNHGMLVDFSNTTAGAGVFNASEGWVNGGGISLLDDATRSFINTPLEINDFGSSSLTFEYIANHGAQIGGSPVIGQTDPSGDTSSQVVFFGINGTQNKLRWRVPGGSNADLGDSPWFVPAVEEIHHVALRFDHVTNGVEIFIDGVSVGMTTRAATNMNMSSLFRIGNSGWSSSQQWDGVMYGVAISDEYLNPESFVIEQFSAGTAGDFNDDGEVDAADYTVWRDAMGSTNMLPNDNGIGGTIGQSHYDLWKANFGSGNGSASGEGAIANSAVPEPAVTMLLLIIAPIQVCTRACRLNWADAR